MTWVDFIAAKYNYWIFITLMMIGLYVVIARGNLIKKLIGLNLFQTSVFIYYISIGKITGGTAPIYVADDMERLARSAGGGDHGEAAHPAVTLPGPAATLPGKDPLGAGAIHGVETPDGGLPLAGNDLATLTGLAPPPALDDAAHGGALHMPPSDSHSLAVNALPGVANAPPDAAAIDNFHIVEDHAAAIDVIHAATKFIYSNPLPHVLILTAIVVGVATTAVGLALVVRIREAYGTIEEDELEIEDQICEYGAPASAVARGDA